MKIVVAPRAERDLSRQLAYLIDHGSARSARRLEQRLATFLEHTLSAYPQIGTFVGHRELWETWVPGTRLVVWYRITAEEVQIARIWHAAQNRDQR